MDRSRMSRTTQYVSHLTFIAFVGLGAQHVFAKPVTLSGGVESKYSDNVTQSANNELSDTETRVTLSVQHQSDPGRCVSETGGSLGYGVWADSTYDPETYADLAFRGLCELRPGLTWQLSDNLRQVQQDSRGTDTPDNRTLKNVFRTGPSYVIPISNRDQINLSINYENTEFREPEETDSERYIGSAGWNHLFNATLSGGISFTADRAELDTGGEIDTDSASFNWSKEWAATRFRGSLGYSELTSRFGSFEQSSDGWIGDLFLERDVTSSLAFFFEASRELTDQTSDFDIRFQDFVFNLRETTEVEVTAVSTGLNKSYSNNADLSVRLYANRADYLRTDDREDVAGLNIAYSQPLRPLLSVQLSGNYEYSRFEVNTQDDVALRLRTGITYSATSDLDLTAQIGHENRESDLPANDFEENWVSVGVNYRFR